MNARIEETLNGINPDAYEEDKTSKKVTELKNYLESNKDKIRYKQYRERGYFIGSGAVESSHKCIIQQRRLKQPGMRWSEHGAQAMACLRTAYKSNNWQRVVDIVFGEVG
jgi:hypothetical protein